LSIVGIPGAGKTTAARFLADYFGVQYIHSSAIARNQCPGDWAARGDMAPEPCTTIAVEETVSGYNQWVLDGFPRAMYQLRSPIIRREPMVFLDVSPAQALIRAIKRGRDDRAIEEKRIREQGQLLAPVRALAAVVIPTSFRTPEQVNQSILDWYLHDVHPNELGSNAR